MAELFKYQTVQNVAFEIRFPNLFFIESKIGDIQYQIMNEFPESEEIIQGQFIITPSANYLPAEDSKNESSTRTIWQFTSPKGYKLNITSNSLSISSTMHKSYNNNDSEHRFRDIIKFVTDAFSEFVPPQMDIKRIGLRYIDKCPLPNNLSNSTFGQLYNTRFDLQRVNITDVSNAVLVLNLNAEDNIELRFKENLQNSDVLYLDFDASKKDVKYDNIMSITDGLYSVVHEEWEKYITETFKDYMRTGELPC